MSWKKQTDIAKKQYQGLLKFDRFDKGDDEEGKRKPELKKYKESYLVYNNNFSFYKYHDTNKSKKNWIKI